MRTLSFAFFLVASVFAVMTAAESPRYGGRRRCIRGSGGDYPAMNDETLEQIQTKIAFLERAAAELSDVVFRQHREIQALDAKLKAVAERLSGAQSDDGSRPPEHERPPHY